MLLGSRDRVVLTWSSFCSCYYVPVIARVRPRLGDVIEIETSKGLAYAQFAHKHRMYGALLRVLPGLFETRPDELTEVVAQRERFILVFPLGAACARGLVHIVRQEPIPGWAQAFPVFRGGFADAHGNVKFWWLWGGERERRQDELTAEQRKLPIRPGVWNDTLLRERIASGWSPSEADLGAR